MNQTLPKPEKPILIIGISATIFMLALPIFLNCLGLTIFPTNAKYLYLKELYPWVVLALLFLYAIKIERQQFLIWSEKSYPFTFYLKSIFKIMFLSLVCAIIVGVSVKLMGLNNKSDITDKLMHIIQKNKLLILLVPFTAGITEELICRGYMLTRLEMLINKPSVSIAVSAIIFGILHISYGTIGQMLIPLCLGLIFAVYYYKYRNIKLIILCHFLWDFIVIYTKVGSK